MFFFFGGEVMNYQLDIITLVVCSCIYLDNRPASKRLRGIEPHSFHCTWWVLVSVCACVLFPVQKKEETTVPKLRWYFYENFRNKSMGSWPKHQKYYSKEKLNKKGNVYSHFSIWRAEKNISSDVPMFPPREGLWKMQLCNIIHILYLWTLKCRRVIYYSCRNSFHLRIACQTVFKKDNFRKFWKRQKKGLGLVRYCILISK